MGVLWCFLPQQISNSSFHIRRVRQPFNRKFRPSGTGKALLHELAILDRLAMLDSTAIVCSPQDADILMKSMQLGLPGFSAYQCDDRYYARNSANLLSQ